MTIEHQERPRTKSQRRHREKIAQPTEKPPAPARRLSRLRLITLGALALILAFVILTRGLGAYLADTSPRAALYLSSSNPTALLNLADDAIQRDEASKVLPPIIAFPRANVRRSSSHAKGDDSEAELDPAPPAEAPGIPADMPAVTDPMAEPDAATTAEQTQAEAPTTPTPPEATSAASPVDYAQIEDWAKKALRNDPLNARALRILGQVAERTSGDDRTEAYMRAATLRSISENLAVYWMAGRSYQNKDYEAALHYADALARTTPRALPYMMPLFARIAETPNANDGLKRLLADNPPWRQTFMERFPLFVTDARTPLDILLGLKDTGKPPQPREIKRYLDFLIGRKFHDLAYYTWLQFLPPEELTKAGYIFNGDFEKRPTNLPFDWTLTLASGVHMEVVEPRDIPGTQALYIKFGPGRVEYKPVQQLVMLGPGSYVLRGKYKADFVSQRPLEWRVTCVNAAKETVGRDVITRSGSTAWSEFEVPFAVPAETCPAQYVQLGFDARTESERFISGSVWFDDIHIARQEPPPGPAEAQPATQSEAGQPQVGTEPQEQPGQSAAVPQAGGHPESQGETQPEAQPPETQAQPEAETQTQSQSQQVESHQAGPLDAQPPLGSQPDAQTPQTQPEPPVRDAQPLPEPQPELLPQ